MLPTNVKIETNIKKCCHIRDGWTNTVKLSESVNTWKMCLRSTIVGYRSGKDELWKKYMLWPAPTRNNTENMQDVPEVKYSVHDLGWLPTNVKCENYTKKCCLNRDGWTNTKILRQLVNTWKMCLRSATDGYRRGNESIMEKWMLWPAPNRKIEKVYMFAGSEIFENLRMWNLRHFA